MCRKEWQSLDREGIQCLWPALFLHESQGESENNRVPDQRSLHSHLMGGLQKMPMVLLK